MKIRLTVFTFFLCHMVIGQYIHPEKTELFRDDVVSRIDILIAEGDLEAVLNENLSIDDLYPATFIFDNGTVRDTLEEVGFRVRGNTSRAADKKSFKIDINAFVKNQRFYGVKAINLNGQHNDPTISRAKICADMAEWLDVPSMRTNHVRLYINNEYRGVYANVEHIDQLFVEKRFGNYNGNLYKCLYPADLKYLGSNPNAYKLNSGDRRTYELKSNELQDDYSDLAHFINVLNNTPNSALQCELEKVFNVDGYIRAMVFDILVGNWDGPIFNQNNFYLYYNEATGKMEYIPYDLDNTLGIDWFNQDWASRNIYSWQPSGANRPIYSKIMVIPEYKSRFTLYMEEAIESFFTANKLYLYVEDMKSLLVPYVENDPFYPLDYGFDLQDLKQGFNGSLPYFHTTYGIRSYIDQRATKALEQLREKDDLTLFYNHTANRPYENENLEVSIQIESYTKPSWIALCYSLNNDPEICIEMSDDGDNIYSAIVPPFESTGNLNYRIQVDNQDGSFSNFPSCDGIDIFIEEQVSHLVINEFMAKNDNTIADITDDYKDWIELYNAGSTPIYLGNKYLSDKEDNPDKWQLPDLYLKPDKYVLFWAGDDPYEGTYQTNFKLSAAGEFLGLFDKASTGYAMIDGIDFLEQKADVSTGRLPNGSGPFVRLVPTPRAKNGEVTDVKDIPTDHLLLYPNPATSTIYIDPTINAASIMIYDQLGTAVMKEQDISTIDVSLLSDGLYYMVIKDIGGKEYSNLFLKV